MSQPEYRGADAFVERPFALEEILAAVRSAATPEERHDDDATIAQIAAVVRSHRLPVHRPVERRLASSGRRIGTRLAAAMVVTVLTAGSSLALTGELPRAAREAASGFLARVGLPAPSVRIVAQGRFTPPHTTGQAFGPTGSAGSGRVVIEPDDFVSASNVPAVVVQHDGSAQSGGSNEQAPSGDGSASPTVSPHDDANGSGGNASPNGNGNGNEGNGNGNEGNGNGNEGNGNGNEGNGNGGQGDEPATPIDPPGSGEPATDAGSIEDPDEAGQSPDGDEAPPEDETPPVQPPDGGPAPDPRPPADPPGNGQPPTEPGPPSEPPGRAPVDPVPPADAGPPEEVGPPEDAGLPEGLDLPDQATLATARQATDPTA